MGCRDLENESEHYGYIGLFLSFHPSLHPSHALSVLDSFNNPPLSSSFFSSPCHLFSSCFLCDLLTHIWPYQPCQTSPHSQSPRFCGPVTLASSTMAIPEVLTVIWHLSGCNRSAPRWLSKCKFIFILGEQNSLWNLVKNHFRTLTACTAKSMHKCNIFRHAVIFILCFKKSVLLFLSEKCFDKFCRIFLDFFLAFFCRRQPSYGICVCICKKFEINVKSAQ